MSDEFLATPAAPPGLSADERRSLRREVLRLAWPVVLQNLLHTMMFYVDTYMLTRVGKEAAAAMQIAGPVSYTLLAVLTAISVGTVATVARAWGEGDRPKQEREAATGIAFAGLLGLPLSVLGAFFLPWMADLYEVPGSASVSRMAKGYLFWQGLVLFFLCLYMVAAGILRGAGNTRVPMLAALAGNLLNVFLNWVFIYGNLGAPAMGVEGAGLATAAASVLEAGLAFGFLLTPASPVRLRPSSLVRVTRDSIVRLVRVTIPAAVEPLILQTGFLIYAKAITLLGATAMAAHRMAITVESLTFMPAHGFAVAGSALVGQYLGAGRPDKADAGLRTSARMSTGLISAAGILFLMAPVPLVRLFDPGSEEAVYAAALCLAISALEQPFMALAMALGGALRGAGDTRSPVLVALAGVWLVRIPLAWALAFPAGLGLNGIWITMIADWFVRTAIFSVLYRRGKWKAIKL